MYIKTLAYPPHVVQIPNVAISTNKVSVLVLSITLGLPLLVDQNAYKILIVLRIWHVLIISVKTLAQVYAV